MNPQWSPAVQDAFARGEAAMNAGDVARACKLYEYAQRLEPSDGEITIAIGLSRMLQGDRRASEPFELIARRDDLVDAWLALVAVRRMFGRPDLALEDLATALSRHGVPRDPEHLALYDSVVAEADAAGWCTISNTDVLTVSLIDSQADFRTLEVRIDGQPLPRIFATPPISGDSVRLFLALPKRWRNASSLTVTLRGRHLVGSPLAVSRIGRVEGFVTTCDGGIAGWAWIPNDREVPPTLTISAPASGSEPIEIVAVEPATDVRHPRPFANPRRFALSEAQLGQLAGLLRVRGPDGRDLYGSPLYPDMEQRSAAAAAGFARLLFPAGGRRRPLPKEFPMPSVPAKIVGRRASAPLSADRKVDVIIPVYAGLDETLACIDSVITTTGRNVRCVIVEDCSPDAALVAALLKLKAKRRIVLIRNEQNKGFPGTANTGMRYARGRDVVLLNSDTLVAPGWLEALRQVVQQEPDIGTATPLSNDATILSYPEVNGNNPIPDLAATRTLDALARRVNQGIVVDVPTGVGFCMYIRRECLDSVGLLREDVFAQGYGEENDFCIRARHMGWRNVAVAAAFVAHVGGKSFGPAKAHLIERNLVILNRLHPGYDAMIAEYLEHDPLRPARRALDEARWLASMPEGGSVILTTHNRGGGVLHHIARRSDAIRKQEQRAVVLTPAKGASGVTECVVADGCGDAYPNLRYEMPAEIERLVNLLRAGQPTEVEIHHFIAHDAAVLRLPETLGVPYNVIVHDYAWLCPRINLLDGRQQYCGEPEVEVCETCIDDAGGKIDETISPTALRERSRLMLQAASGIVVPSRDAGRRLRRHFQFTNPRVGNWDDDMSLPPLGEPPRRDGVVRVCLAGAIGIEKGYEFLLACARHCAKHDLPVEFVVVGYTCDDQRLLKTNRVTITGRYEQSESIALIRSQEADIGFLPAIWPETWCYALSELWMAGMPVLAFDLGAPADRIRQTGRGWLVPLKTRPDLMIERLTSLVYRARAANRYLFGPAVRLPNGQRKKAGNTQKGLEVNERAATAVPFMAS
jgi:GT2 family glycosyltransferase/glycosyltransferase involved in cell wall biosynthesis